MGNLYRYIKKKKIDKAVCACLAAALFVGGGFMGINSYKADRRTLDVQDGESRDVSLDILVSGNSVKSTEETAVQMTIAPCL